ncbi:hypothetical protein Q4Q39_13405 [Flavivirga amylovorans]|uniref:Glycoside hydrolase family 5 domain-containing protein n=1 Tax=Flavivirga amylovorans TaxID=870486 RepID=A0ABT8X3X1_9FLAO|nr:cellulase family glycosylhydrolase [Flavivirga amylovorans]MDO5988403.1 hypothetical protein [Flavivirga amylovorans]
MKKGYIKTRYKLSLLFVVITYFVIIMTAFGCDDDEYDVKIEEQSKDLVVKTGEVLIESYIGNGVQWDPYPQAYRYWNQPIQDADWNKMYTRLDYMKPSFIRVVFGSYDKYAISGADNYEPTAMYEGLGKILQYCQDNDITVMLGDWGYNQVDSGNDMIFESRIDNAVNYLDYLVNTQGFTCIKYYTTINEPNLNGSAANGNYNVWKNATAYFYDKMVDAGLDSKVKLAGPDIAIFNDNDVSWISNTETDLGNKIDLYDIHTYPSKGSLFSGEFEALLKAYKSQMPEGKQAVIGEFGFKYETGFSVMDMELSNENLNNINSDPFVGTDSNTLVDQYIHGVDLVGLNLKIINSGFAGAINWNLDDAMHSSSNTGQDLKVWGYWNILGDELLGKPEKETIRPHFYSFSLISRYMQKGSKVYKVEVPKLVGLDAIAVEKDGKYMIAINNMSINEYNINFSLDNGTELSGLKKFIYKEDNRLTDANGFPLPEEQNLSIGKGNEINIKPQTLTVYTNFDF